MPSTRQPLARSSCTVIRPISPSPVTTTVSPSVGAPAGYPASPIDASTVKAAASSSTSSGTSRTEVLRNAHKLGMRAVGSYAVTDREPPRRRQLRPRCPHCSNRGLAADRACFAPRQAWEQAIGAHLLEHHLNFLGLLARLVDQARRGQSRPAFARCRRKPASAKSRSAACRGLPVVLVHLPTQ